ncbi:MBOAT family protein [Bacteroidota bacterium]|nr:MBOAT family protein [Bacteroidota bacterium]
MLAVTMVNFFGGIKINASRSKKSKKYWLALTIFLSLIPLIYFKYFNFLIENINFIIPFFDNNLQLPYIEIILPVGISFFTFQALSYSLDVYYGKTNVEYNFINFSGFVAFFPQLVAGPIERSSNLLSQFRNKHLFLKENFLIGAKLFIWGLFKKVVIADRLAIYVNNIYDNPELFNSATLAVATMFFAFQIYCDFSGYSDMAIGSAKILGFNLRQNFNLPYLANSIGDFWKRWHISLSSWFGDYLYIPLGGNRVRYYRWVINIFLVFLLSGFWHGASWTFIIWGSLHAFYYLVESWGDKFLNLIDFNFIKRYWGYKVFKILTVFVLVCFAWVFFRANSITDAFFIIDEILSFKKGDLYIGSSAVTFILSIFLIFLLLIVQIMQYLKIASMYFYKSKAPASIQFLWYLLICVAISTLSVSSNAFIYFQF